MNIKVPQKGMKEKLVELAYKNALLVLSQDKERIKERRGAHNRSCKGNRGTFGLTWLKPYGGL